jgi:hypothetical protein
MVCAWHRAGRTAGYRDTTHRFHMNLALMGDSDDEVMALMSPGTLGIGARCAVRELRTRALGLGASSLAASS